MIPARIANAVGARTRYKMPGVVVDLTKGGAAALSPTPGLAGVKNDDLSADDKFADRVAAAEMLGLSRQSLYVKLHRYGMVSEADSE